MFDGHGSKEAAKFVAKNLSVKLRESLDKTISSTSIAPRTESEPANLTEDQTRICKSQDELIAKMPDALFKTFLSLDEAFRETGQV